MVVGARCVELCSAGVGRHLLFDHRATLQGVQREVPEAARTLGNRQQTERRQTEERYESFWCLETGLILI